VRCSFLVGGGQCSSPVVDWMTVKTEFGTVVVLVCPVHKEKAKWTDRKTLSTAT
jgi:hypothetical protein